MRLLHRDDVETACVEQLRHIAAGMGIAPRIPQDQVFRPGMNLDGKGKKAARGQHGSHRAEHPFEPAKIDQDVGRRDEVYAIGARSQHLQVALLKTVVHTLRPRPRQHTRRNVDPFEEACDAPQTLAHQAGATAKIDGVRESDAARSGDRLRNQFGDPIAKPLHQGAVELAGILVEQRFHEAARRHFGYGQDARKFELQRCTQPVGGIEPQGFAPSLHRLARTAGLVIQLAQAKPARHPVRRDRNRIAHQVGRGGNVAAIAQHLGIVRAAIGNEIAGRERKAFHDVSGTRVHAGGWHMRRQQ